MMRLQPIEKPPTLLARLAYRLTKKHFGKVITPLKVVYARVPKSLPMARHMTNLVDHGMTLDRELKYLVQTLVSSVNGCAFCVDFGQHRAMKQRLPVERLRAVMDYATDARFSPRDRAALTYAEEVTRTKHCSDDTFAQLREHFNDTEIAELTMLIAIDNYYNLISIPLGIESDGFCSLPDRDKRPAQAQSATTAT